MLFFLKIDVRQKSLPFPSPGFLLALCKFSFFFSHKNLSIINPPYSGTPDSTAGEPFSKMNKGETLSVGLGNTAEKPIRIVKFHIDQ